MEPQIHDTWPKDGFERLRSKWSTVPAGGPQRVSSSELLKLDDNELVRVWKAARNGDVQGPGFQLRGWYHELYEEFIKEKKVLDIGCGFGISSISFAQMGASVTFVDIVEENLKLAERICRSLNIADRVSFCYLRAIADLAVLPRDYDVVTAIGSLHHAPSEFVRPEIAEIVGHLKIGGRWLQFAYPYARWVREGKLPFSEWGERTDGEGTPYAEWYNLNKLLQLLAPARFEPLFTCEWHHHDFNWFDLKLIAYDGAALRGAEDPLQDTDDPVWRELCSTGETLQQSQAARQELEQQCRQLEEQFGELEQQFKEVNSSFEREHAHLQSIENSTGWKMLKRWHKIRDRMAPDGSQRRRIYDSLRGIKH